ncbi:MAG TPA: BrnT family toxin [Thermoanaerobaculia bacterium]|nr:BrnT family toxin [Thermoanaerobaculia bacterium]
MADYEWDPVKGASNYRKHGVHFADAVAVLEDERAITIPDPAGYEERFKTLGTDALGRVLVVAYSHRGERIRLISARKANAPQRAVYERKRR